MATAIRGCHFCVRIPVCQKMKIISNFKSLNFNMLKLLIIFI